MIAWLWNIIVGRSCRHEWETMGTTRLEGEFGGIGTRIRLRCKKCGDWKKKDLI